MKKPTNIKLYCIGDLDNHTTEELQMEYEDDDNFYFTHTSSNVNLCIIPKWGINRTAFYLSKREALEAMLNILEDQISSFRSHTEEIISSAMNLRDKLNNNNY